MRAHLGCWLRRYLPAESIALVAALACAQVGLHLSGNVGVAALAAAWGETIAYYATMLLRELRAASLPRAVRNLVLEFGVAEALDTLLIRPALMILASQLLTNLTFGVIVGKLAADVLFYIPAVAAFELRRRYLPA